jgi:hypothetical protein
LDSAAKVMEMYATSRALLELEYFDEAGTGLGPTLEFYALLAQEVQRKSLDMWRCEHGASSDGDSAVAIKADATPPGNAVIISEDSQFTVPKAPPLQVTP